MYDLLEVNMDTEIRPYNGASFDYFCDTIFNLLVSVHVLTLCN